MILKGNDLLIKVGGTAIAAAKSCDISIQADEIEIASPSSGKWSESIIGRMSWSATVNHLVLSVVRSYQMVGTTVSLEVSVRGMVGGPGKAFQGFVDNVTIQEGTWSGSASAIYWDKTRKKFVAHFTPAPNVSFYMENWTDGSAPYTSPSPYDIFRYNGVAYSWLSNNLVAEKLTGIANVTSWKVTGTRGNLCAGVFEFRGNGALNPATIP